MSLYDKGTFDDKKGGLGGEFTRQLPPDSVQISNMYRHRDGKLLALTAGVPRIVILLADSSHIDVIPQR